MSCEFLVNNRIRNTCPTGDPKNTRLSFTLIIILTYYHRNYHYFYYFLQAYPINPTWVESTRVYNVGANVAVKVRNSILISCAKEFSSAVVAGAYCKN